MNLHGEVVSKKVCDPWTIFFQANGSDYTISRNFGLRLRRLWAEALTACGYNEEEFNLRSAPFEEVSDINEEDSRPTKKNLKLIQIK